MTNNWLEFLPRKLGGLQGNAGETFHTNVSSSVRWSRYICFVLGGGYVSHKYQSVKFDFPKAVSCIISYVRERTFTSIHLIVSFSRRSRPGNRNRNRDRRNKMNLDIFKA